MVSRRKTSLHFRTDQAEPSYRSYYKFVDLLFRGELYRSRAKKSGINLANQDVLTLQKKSVLFVQSVY